MKFKKTIGLSAFVLASLALISCNGNNNSPNTIKYLDENGEEVEYTFEKTDNASSTSDALNVLKTAALQNEKFKNILNSFTGVSVKEKNNFELTQNYSSSSTFVDIIVERKTTNNSVIDIKNEKTKDEAKITATSIVNYFGGKSTSKAKSTIKTLIGNDSDGSGLIALVDQNVISPQAYNEKYYTELSIDFNDIDFTNIYNLSTFYETISTNVLKITDTSKNTITIQYTYNPNSTQLSLFDDLDNETFADAKSVVEKILENLTYRIEVNTKTFLPKKIECKFGKKFSILPHLTYQYQQTFSSADITFNSEAEMTLKYGNYSVEDEIDITGYKYKAK